MTARESDKSASAAPTPKDAQKGGQGAIGKGDNEAELNEKGHPGGESQKPKPRDTQRGSRRMRGEGLGRLHPSERLTRSNRLSFPVLKASQCRPLFNLQPLARPKSPPTYRARSSNRHRDCSENGPFVHSPDVSRLSGLFQARRPFWTGGGSDGLSSWTDIVNLNGCGPRELNGRYGGE
jgi:hypothetical protein